MARSRWTVMGNQAGEGFGAGFNYGMKPAIDRANSLADLKAKIDQLGQMNPQGLNELQLAALGVSPKDQAQITFEEFQALPAAGQKQYLQYSGKYPEYDPSKYAQANLLNMIIPSIKQATQNAANMTEPNAQGGQTTSPFEVVGLDVGGITIKNTSPNTPLSGEAAKTYELANDGLRGVDSLKSKINSSASFVVPSLFDRQTAYDINKIRESIGRLNSGAVISPDEAKNFERLIPTFLDSPELRQRKLDDLKMKFSGVASKIVGEKRFQNEQAQQKKSQGTVSTPTISDIDAQIDAINKELGQ